MAAGTVTTRIMINLRDLGDSIKRSHDHNTSGITNTYGPRFVTLGSKASTNIVIPMSRCNLVYIHMLCTVRSATVACGLSSFAHSGWGFFTWGSAGSCSVDGSVSTMSTTLAHFGLRENEHMLFRPMYTLSADGGYHATNSGHMSCHVMSPLGCTFEFTVVGS